MQTKEKKILTKDQILQAEDFRIEEIQIPEWNGSVFVRSLTGKERDQFEASIVQPGSKGWRGKVDTENVRAKLVALCTVDEKGIRLFDLKDADALGDKNAAALDRIFAVAQRLSGFTQKDIEELAKNSSGGQSEDSTSG